MAYVPRPSVLKCEQCKWSKIINLKSDAITLGMVPDKCPTCGSEQLKGKRLALPDVVVSLLKPFL